jgi:hypothetical protein
MFNEFVFEFNEPDCACDEIAKDNKTTTPVIVLKEKKF